MKQLRRILTIENIVLVMLLNVGAALLLRLLFDDSMMDLILLSMEFALGVLLLERLLGLKNRLVKKTTWHYIEKKNLEDVCVALAEQAVKDIDKGLTATIVNTRAEITALQSQINPHFLYNTLDTIRGQALIDDSPIVAEMTEALAHIFRYSISETGKLVTLQTELRNVEKYLLIQKFRFEEKFDLSISYEEEDLLKCYIPKLSLQPIVENSIYHGLETVTEGGKIDVCVYSTEKNLIISIRDNGKGMGDDMLAKINESLQMKYSMPHANQRKHTGIALSNVHQRLKLYFGESYGLVVQSVMNKGTQVELVMPLVMEENLDAYSNGIF